MTNSKKDSRPNQYTFPDGTIIDFGNRDPQKCLDDYVKWLDKKRSKPVDSKKDSELENKNIKVNKDGTISPIDPTQPSKYSTLKFEPTDISEDGILRAILLGMDWCHAVKTESLEKTIQAINSKYITKEESDRRVLEARSDEQSRALQYMQGWKYKDDYKRKIAELRELLKGGEDE